MGLRPARCYRSLKDRAFTRIAITKHEKNYVGATPAMRIKQFNMGNPSKDYTHVVDLRAGAAIQIRDNAIESSRIAVNRYIQNSIGKENYFMRIRVYPFHIMRENKQAQGAGADRVSQGMAHSFGKAIGKSVRTKKGQVLISLLVDEENVDVAKKALLRASSKLPCKVSISVHTDIESIGTRPRAMKIKIAEEKEEKEREEEAEKKEKEAGKSEIKEKGKEGKETEKSEGKEKSKEEKESEKSEGKEKSKEGKSEKK